MGTRKSVGSGRKTVLQSDSGSPPNDHDTLRTQRVLRARIGFLSTCADDFCSDGSVDQRDGYTASGPRNRSRRSGQLLRRVLWFLRAQAAVFASLMEGVPEVPCVGWPERRDDF